MGSKKLIRKPRLIMCAYARLLHQCFVKHLHVVMLLLDLILF